MRQRIGLLAAHPATQVDALGSKRIGNLDRDDLDGQVQEIDDEALQLPVEVKQA